MRSLPFLCPLAALLLLTAAATPATAQTAFTHDPDGNRATQAAVTTPAAPTIQTAPSDQVARLGGSAQFVVLAGGTGPFTYQWFAGASPIAGATDDTLVLTNLTAASFTPNPAGAPKYSVRVTNAAGNITSTAAALYQDSLGQGLPDWWRQQFFGSLTVAVDPNVDPDADGVSNLQEYRDNTAPDSATSRLGRLTLRGPANLVNAFPARDTYAEGTAVSARGGSFGELQFGGWTGSLRSPASEFAFNFGSGGSLVGDLLLVGLFGAMPVENHPLPPFFANASAAPASVVNVATAPDGSMIVCGTFERIGILARRFVARIQPDGTPDPAFAPVADASVFTAAVQRDGKIVVVGSFTQINGQPRPGVARLLANGTLDTTFAPPGQGTNVSQVSTVAIQRDGKILVGGAVWAGSGFVPLRRFNADGSVDTAFAPTLNGLPTAIAVQPDGRIVLGGGFTQVNGVTVPKLVRLLPADGALDPAFSASTTDGVATQPAAVIVQPDGRILAGGSVQVRFNGSNVTLPVVRLLADGTLDAAFTGRVATALSPTPTFRALALQDDGRIVGVGSFTLTRPDVVNAVRLEADGSLDPDAFVISRANGPVNAVAAQSDRGLVFGGDFVTLTPREGPVGHHRYLLTASRQTWPVAEAEAQASGGHLLAINGAAEQNFVQKTLLQNFGFLNETSWLGFSDRGVEGLFAWSSGEPVTYTNWNGGEPNNGQGAGEDAGEIHGVNVNPPGRWNDLPETAQKFGIIEVDPAAPVTQSTAWVAGRDLARNERAGAMRELTNPNGTVPEWSYGIRSTQTSATNELSLFVAAEHVNETSLEGWRRPQFASVRVNAAFNGIGSPTGLIRPDELVLHPPPTGFTVVRWTAPVAGTYAVSAFWQDVDWNGGDGGNASIVRNGTQVVFSLDFDNAHGPSTNHTLTLAAGDTLDFLLGVRGNDGADSTRFNAVVKRIPDANTSVWVAGRDLVANEKPDGGAQETQNPNPTVPAWSYGSRGTVVTGGLTLFTAAEHLNTFTGTAADDANEGFASNPRGAVGANTGTTPIAYNYGFGPNLPFYPGEMVWGPAGSGGPFPIVRWTAPAAGNYDIFAWWQDSDFHGGNGFSAHLVVNGGQVYGQDIDNAHGASTFQTLALKAGDQVDFTMGVRGSFDFDTTKFNAAIFGPNVPPTPTGNPVTPVSTRAALAGNATLDWATVAANNAQLPNPFGVSASNGMAFRVSKGTEGAFGRLTQGNGWFGNFAPGDAVLNHVNNDGPVVITAAGRGGVFSALGAQIMPSQDGAFTVTVRAFDVNGASLGTATFNGTGNSNADNSAIFAGVRSDTANIHAVSFDTNTTGFGGDFALNHVSVVAPPAANGDLAQARGGFARLVTTNLLSPGPLGANPTGPLFAANATVALSLAPQTADAPILGVRLERSADGGQVFADAGPLSAAGGGLWNGNPVLPPGTSHYRAVVTDNRQQQRRSFAVGPFVTPPAVISPLAVNGNVGVPFGYVATATGPLSGFTVSGLPVWAAASYDPASERLTLTGTPTAPGLHTLTLTPTNAAGSTPTALTLTVSHTFESWRAANFTSAELMNPALSGPLGDATGAGLANLLRYALGLPAKGNAAAGLPRVSVTNVNGTRYLTLTYTRDKTASGVSLAVQVAGELVGGAANGGWNAGNGFTTELSRTDHGNGTETVVTRDNVALTAAGRRFMRLQVSQ